MSYCRWSSLNGRCDLYVYASDGDLWVTHVASLRWPLGAPSDPLGIFDDPRAKQMSAEELGMEYKRRSEAWQDWAEANPAQPFHNDHAGKSFGDGSPGECADRLEGLRRDGLIFPNEIIVALRAEQREMDGTADPPVT